jgi:hypothetical protein
MTATIRLKYTKNEVAKLREEAIQQWVLPAIRAQFVTRPELQSATMLVAQFWNDEADDAVHCSVVYSILATPDVAAAAKAEDDDSDDAVNLPKGVAQYDLDSVRHWDSNNEAIPRFAAFTKEDCDQEMTMGESYVPYAIFRRRGGDVAIETVGTMLRPWLDGVLPVWEAEQNK